MELALAGLADGDDEGDAAHTALVARVLIQGFLDPMLVTGSRGADAARDIDFVHALAHALTDSKRVDLARCVCATLLACPEAGARLVATVAVHSGPHDLETAQTLRAHAVHALAIGAHLATEAARAARAHARPHPGMQLALDLLQQGVPFVGRCFELPVAECSALCRADARRYLVAGLCNLRHAAEAGGLRQDQQRAHAQALVLLGRDLRAALEDRRDVGMALTAVVHHVSRGVHAEALRAVWAPIAADLLRTAHAHGDGPPLLWCALKGLVGDRGSAVCLEPACAAFEAAMASQKPVLATCLPILQELQAMCRRWTAADLGAAFPCCVFKLKDLVCAVARDFPGILGEVRKRPPLIPNVNGHALHSVYVCVDAPRVMHGRARRTPRRLPVWPRNADACPAPAAPTTPLRKTL